jgi:hypothetical protein
MIIRSSSTNLAAKASYCSALRCSLFLGVSFENVGRFGGIRRRASVAIAAASKLLPSTKPVSPGLSASGKACSPFAEPPSGVQDPGSNQADLSRRAVPRRRAAPVVVVVVAGSVAGSLSILSSFAFFSSSLFLAYVTLLQGILGCQSSVHGTPNERGVENDDHNKHPVNRCITVTVSINSNTNCSFTVEFTPNAVYARK